MLADFISPLSLNASLMGARTVTWKFLTLLKNLVDHVASEIMHVFVLKLLNGVSTHNLVTDLMFMFTDHQTRVLIVIITLISFYVVILNFFFHSLVQELLLIVIKLIERTD